MAKLGSVGTVLVAGESVPLRIVVQGYRSSWFGVARDADGNGIDLSSITLSCRAEFWMATIVVTTSRTDGDTATVTNFAELDPPVADRSLNVIKSDQSTHPGWFSIPIPPDIYTGDIAPDTDNLPVAVAYLKYDDGSDVRVTRFMLAFRRGITT